MINHAKIKLCSTTTNKIQILKKKLFVYFFIFST